MRLLVRDPIARLEKVIKINEISTLLQGFHETYGILRFPRLAGLGWLRWLAVAGLAGWLGWLAGWLAGCAGGQYANVRATIESETARGDQ